VKKGLPDDGAQLPHPTFNVLVRCREVGRYSNARLERVRGGENRFTPSNEGQLTSTFIRCGNWRKAWDAGRGRCLPFNAEFAEARRSRGEKTKSGVRGCLEVGANPEILRARRKKHVLKIKGLRGVSREKSKGVNCRIDSGGPMQIPALILPLCWRCLATAAHRLGLWFYRPPCRPLLRLLRWH
jgi:hypothetical protein